MAILSTISRLGDALAGGNLASKADAEAALQCCYAGIVARGNLMRLQASLAPHASGEQQMQALAAHADRTAVWVREQFDALNVELPEQGAVVSPTALNSHWARLVHALKLHQAAAHEASKLAGRFVDDHPPAAPIFERIQLDTQAQITRIRDLISRADPLASD